MIFGAPFVFMIVALFHGPELFKFYHALATKGAEDTSGIVESYRTMREHGNAFLILVFELAMAFPIWVCFFHDGSRLAKAAANITAVEFAAIWLLPAAAAWIVATRLEMYFEAGNRSISASR